VQTETGPENRDVCGVKDIAEKLVLKERTAYAFCNGTTVYLHTHLHTLGVQMRAKTGIFYLISGIFAYAKTPEIVEIPRVLNGDPSEGRTLDTLIKSQVIKPLYALKFQHL
jgi:hypothetical protein